MNARMLDPYVVRTGERDFHFASLEQALFTRDILQRLGADAALVLLTLDRPASRVPLMA